MFLFKKLKNENFFLKEKLKKEKELIQLYFLLSDSRGDFLFLLEGHFKEILEAFEQEDVSKVKAILKKVEEERGNFIKHNKFLLSSICSVRGEMVVLEKKFWQKKVFTILDELKSNLLATEGDKKNENF